MWVSGNFSMFWHFKHVKHSKFLHLLIYICICVCVGVSILGTLQVKQNAKRLYKCIFFSSLSFETFWKTGPLAFLFPWPHPCTLPPPSQWRTHSYTSGGERACWCGMAPLLPSPKLQFRSKFTSLVSGEGARPCQKLTDALAFPHRKTLSDTKSKEINV